MAIAAVGAMLGCLLWAAGAVALATLFFPDAPLATVVAAALTVPTQLLLTVGKTALQGLGDRRGGDTVIAAEEIAFLPCYLLAAPRRPPRPGRDRARPRARRPRGRRRSRGGPWPGGCTGGGWACPATTAGGAGHAPTWPGRSLPTACAASSAD